MTKSVRVSTKPLKWWKEKPNPTERHDYKKALVSYIILMKRTEDYPEDNMETYRQVLVHLWPINERWKSVTYANLAAKYAAHRYYIDTLKNTLGSKKELKTMIETKVKELAKAKEVTDGSEEENEAEQDEGQFCKKSQDQIPNPCSVAEENLRVIKKIKDIRPFSPEEFLNVG